MKTFAYINTDKRMYCLLFLLQVYYYYKKIVISHECSKNNDVVIRNLFLENDRNVLQIAKKQIKRL